MVTDQMTLMICLFILMTTAVRCLQDCWLTHHQMTLTTTQSLRSYPTPHLTHQPCRYDNLQGYQSCLPWALHQRVLFIHLPWITLVMRIMRYEPVSGEVMNKGKHVMKGASLMSHLTHLISFVSAMMIHRTLLMP